MATEIEERLKSMGLFERYSDIRTRQALMTPEEQAQSQTSSSPNVTREDTGEITADQLGEGGDFVMPEPTQITPDLAKADGATQFMKTKIEEEEKEAERLKQEREAAEAEQPEQPSTFSKFLTGLGFKTEQEKRAEAEEVTGIDPEEYFAERKADVAEVEALYTDYNNTVTARDNALLRKEEQLQGYPGGILRGEQALINKQYNITLSQKSAAINTKMAIMQMKQENFAEAQSFIDDAVADYLAPLEADYQVFQQFRLENQERIDQLNDEEKEALDRAEAYQLELFNRAEEDANAVKQLLLQYPNAGIKIGDTEEEALEKIGRLPAEVDILSVSEAKALGVPYGTTREQALGITPVTERVGPPPTKLVDGTLYQWDEATSSWTPAPGIAPGTERVTPSEQRQIDKDFATDVEDEKGAFYKGLRQIDTMFGKRPTMEELAEIAVDEGVSFDGFREALESYEGMVLYPDGEVWTTKWKNQRVGNLKDESVRNKFGGGAVGAVSAGASDEDIANILFGE